MNNKLYLAIGLVAGLVIGALVGMVTNQIPLYTCIGAAIGLIMSSQFDSKK